MLGVIPWELVRGSKGIGVRSPDRVRDRGGAADLPGLTLRDACAMRKRVSDPVGTWTDDDARTVLEEWQRSGDSIAAFARRHSLSAWRLYSWRQKLQTTAKPRAAPTLSLVPASIVTVSSA